jgi:hypothetical protein
MFFTFSVMESKKEGRAFLDKECFYSIPQTSTFAPWNLMLKKLIGLSAIAVPFSRSSLRQAKG